MENKSGSEFEDYRYFDPKLYRRQDTNIPRVKQPFDEAFVFVIGGGSYVEYQNLLDWVKSTCNTTSISSSASSTSLATSVNGVNNRANQGVHDASSSLNLREQPTQNTLLTVVLICWECLEKSCKLQSHYSVFLSQLTACFTKRFRNVDVLVGAM
uniref:Uncharacterized protein n=1 Tax=Trichobilharzia regenti TaxID=157069 RepID=A0AA85KCF0_TRIRE|nr:unnamed protein product [Trichobilharzia regenti]